MSLEVSIDKQYKNFTLSVNFDTQQESTGLLGASGCGKSLTLKCIAGIVTPDRGRIVLNNKVLFDSEKKINLPARERKVGYMFQQYALFPNMTVSENISIAVSGKKDKKEVLDKLLQLLRIERLRNHYPQQLSGGEQQRVALARMLAYEAKVLMFDEPFSALDSFLKEQLQQELLEVLTAYQGEILMVSHSRDELYRFSEKIIIIDRGRIVEEGKKQDIFNHPTYVTSAKLTGCKNISRAVKLSDYQIKAIDWNVILRTDVLVNNEVNFVGIRAHHIQAAHNQNEENMVPVSLQGFSEGPFEKRLILKASTETEENKLWWIVPNPVWKRDFDETLPNKITLPKEHLLLLKN
ncbi:MAG: ATP-binding cassette domain-containing protein [Mobilitalea sp.]